MGGFTIFGNTTTVPPVNWQPEPNTRGTWSVLSSSLITLALCLWTALHLNIPEHGKDPNQRWRKFGWLVIGLFAPELVAFTAWYQYRTAKELTKKMKSRLGEPPPPVCYKWTCWLVSPFHSKPCIASRHVEDAETQAKLTGKSRHPWTTVHSFFAVMGGFAFSTDRAESNFLPDSLTRLCVNPKGLVFLAEYAPHLLPDLSKSDILDKSKASGLAKFLVCVQATWFCVQSIHRMAQGYAISLLELNVFGHALCALLIYGFWWHKPLDIQEPTLIPQTEDAWELCALMCVMSVRDTEDFYTSYEDSLNMVEIYQPFSFLNTRPWHELVLRKDGYNNMPQMNMMWDPMRKPIHEDDTNKMAEATLVSEQGGREHLRLREGENLYGFRCQPLDSQSMHTTLISYVLKRKTRLPYDEPTECVLKRSDIRRLELCSKILHRDFLPGRDPCFSIGSLRRTVFARIPNKPVLLDMEYSIIIFYLAITLAGLVYGGLHLLAWNGPFHSRAEQILWRFSGLLIPAAGPAMVALNLALGSMEDPDILIFDIAKLFLLVIVLPSLVSAYVLARVFLVVESFLQLARLPQSAYLVPSWSQYFPHL